jgi:hypothetical protein
LPIDKPKKPRGGGEGPGKIGREGFSVH